MSIGNIVSLIIITTCLSVQASPTGTLVKIMPLGDSITAGLCDGRDAQGNCMYPQDTAPTPNCIDKYNTGINPKATGYRPYLKQLLNNSGLWSQFVGSMGSTDQPFVFNDRLHEGHGGWTISGINSCASTWVTSANPDIILLHIGTNDVLQERPLSNMIENLNALVSNIYTAKPSVRLIVAQIIPTSYSTSAEAKVLEYNNYIKNNLAANFPGKNMTIVGMNAYSSNNSNPLEQLNISDLSSGSVCLAYPPKTCQPTYGVHPSSAGYQKMALAWSNAIQNQMQQVETITANGKYWNYPNGSYLTPLSASLSSVPRYSSICNGAENCKLDTYTFWGDNTTFEVESITANGFDWNFNAINLSLIAAGSLNSVSRYDAYICTGRTPCTFDTRTFKTNLVKNAFGDGPNYTDGTSVIEAITAYGSYWEFDPYGNLIASGNLNAVPKYNPICSGRSPCTFDTRTFVTIGDYTVESITAYGNYWNLDLDGNLLASGSLNGVSRYASICNGANPCTFETRAFWIWGYK